MEQFSEDRLELFKQMEMTRNACCEVYLQYGN